jgi:hypothetical protein
MLLRTTSIPTPRPEMRVTRSAVEKPGSRGLDPVVDRVAHEMNERVLDRLDDRLVELGLAALHRDADLLAAGDCEVAHDARQLPPEPADRLHAGLRHALLQRGGDRVEPLGGRGERGLGARAADLEELVAGEHELADEVHQPIEQPHVDADRGIDGRPIAAGRVIGRRGRWRRRGGRRRGRRLCGTQACQPAEQCRVIGVAVGAGRLDASQHRPHRVDQLEQARRDLGRERKRAVAETAEQAFARVRDRLEPAEAEEAAGALDRVDRAEHAPKGLPRAGILLERHEVAVELVEVLAALDQELPDDIGHVARIAHAVGKPSRPLRMYRPPGGAA